jgi:hypothetical protein
MTPKTILITINHELLRIPKSKKCAQLTNFHEKTSFFIREIQLTEKPTETVLTVGKNVYNGENTRDTLELQTGSEVVDCLAKNGNPDPIIELRIDGDTVDATESSCTGDRNSVYVYFKFLKYVSCRN